MSELIGKSIDRYHILEQLGRGGMATVYKAYDTRLERDVAVKLIRKEAFSAEVLERVLKRFEREAKALARLSHTHIINVHDYGEFEGSPYLVMEYMPGGTLKDKLGTPLPPDDAARLLRPIAQALAHAHDEGIIHRDIKPSNILIDKNSAPKLADFSIARILELGSEATALTGTGMGVGTPEYMAPEQGLGKDVDARTDIYALGVVQYEMVTGQKPYQADTPMAVVIKHIHDPLPRPSGFVADLPIQVEQVLLKAMAKEPENRYETMLAFSDALANIGGSAVPSPVPLPTDLDLTHDQLALDALAVDPFTKIPKLGGFGRWLRRIPVWGWIAAVGVSIAIILLLQIGRGTDGAGSLAWIPTETPIATATATAAHTPTSTNTATATPSATPTSALEIGSTQVSEVDNMIQVYVPAGEFEMGSEDRNSDEEPVHSVYLDAFWMDQTEVTNAMYNECVDASVCEQPDNKTNIGVGEFANHPIVYVNWFDAQSYCEWTGRRLPTEAEWEKAARGNLERKDYPWGNQPPLCTLGVSNGAQYQDCVNETIQVKSFDVNGYLLYDMAGNVWEWVADWYDKEYFSNSPISNPQGPESGVYKILRGGSWTDQVVDLYSANRFKDIPDYAWGYYGFRCAQNVSP